jgi:hypothetical protein
MYQELIKMAAHEKGAAMQNLLRQCMVPILIILFCSFSLFSCGGGGGEEGAVTSPGGGTSGGTSAYLHK